MALQQTRTFYCVHYLSLEVKIGSNIFTFNGNTLFSLSFECFPRLSGADLCRFFSFLPVHDSFAELLIHKRCMCASYKFRFNGSMFVNH